MDEPGAAVREAFREQARACEALGSPFTAWLCRELAERLAADTAVGRRVLTWTGDASHRADSVPLRPCGAIHALSLFGRREALSTAYAKPAPDPTIWNEVEAALAEQAEFVLAVLDGPPQNNEVARAAMVYPAFGFVAERSGLPVELREVGASAGLNLNCDAFRSDRRLAGWRRRLAAAAGTRIARPHPSSPDPEFWWRAGWDLRPFALSDAAAERRLLS